MTTPATWRRPTLGRGSEPVPTRVCPVCPEAFYTQVGLDEHVRIGDHARLIRRWVTGQYSPAGLAVQQANGRQIAALNNARRRRCNDCGQTSTPAGIGHHQHSTGHTGWMDEARPSR